MSEELSIGRAARPAVSPAPTDRAKVVWRPLDATRDQPAPPAPATQQAATGEIVDVAWSPAVANDPDLMMATLRAERAASRAGYDHPHAPVGCSFCRRAAAAYR